MHTRLSFHPRRGLLALSYGLLAVVGLAVLVLLGLLALHSLPGARFPATPETVITARIAPGTALSLVSPANDVTVGFEPGSVDAPSIVTYRSVSAWDIPDLPLGFVATSRVFELSMTRVETAVGTPPPGTSGHLLKPGLLTMDLGGEEASAATFDPSRIVIHHMDPDSGEWGQLSTGVDFETSQASSRLEKPGLFALSIRWMGSQDPADVKAGPPAEHLQLPAAIPTPVPMPRVATISTPNPTKPSQHPEADTSVSGTGLAHHEPPQPTSTVTAQTVFSEAQSPHTMHEGPTPVAASLAIASAVPFLTPTLTPIPPQRWELEEVHVSGDTVTVFVRILQEGLYAVSLDGRETGEIRTSLPYQAHTFRRVTEGKHWVKVWTPGRAPYEEIVEVTVYAPTPIPSGPPTATARPTRTPEPRYSLFINEVQVQPRQVGMFIADGSAIVSPPPKGDGRYKSGEEVTILVSPGSGALLTWGGVDSFDGPFARVRMVADRFVSVHIAPPPTSPLRP